MTREAGLEKLSIKQLRDLRSKVSRLIARKEAEERRNLRDQFRDMAANAGLTLAELMGKARQLRSSGAAKYVNPANPDETWGGRGRMPRWLAEKLKAGAKLNDFLG